MNVSLEIPRERYGLIVGLAERMQAHKFGFGKTALQKLVYFLQELYGVDCGYRFTLYTYGPFSSLLLSDLDSVGAFGGVEVEFYGPAGYRIEPGPKSPAVRKHADRFLGKHAAQIEEVVAVFGSLSASKLELVATIVFAERASSAKGKALSANELAEIVHGIKPHFSKEAILEAIRELSDRKHITAAKRRQKQTA